MAQNWLLPWKREKQSSNVMKTSLFLFFKYLSQNAPPFSRLSFSSSVSEASPSKLFVFPCWNQGNASWNIQRHKEWMAYSIATLLNFFLQKKVFFISKFHSKSSARDLCSFEALSSHLKKEVLIWKKNFHRYQLKFLGKFRNNQRYLASE